MCVFFSIHRVFLSRKFVALNVPPHSVWPHKLQRRHSPMRLLSVPNQGVMRRTNGTSAADSHKTVQFVGDKHSRSACRRVMFNVWVFTKQSAAAEIKIRDAPPRKKQTSGVVVSCRFFLICIFFFLFLASRSKCKYLNSSYCRKFTCSISVSCN